MCCCCLQSLFYGKTWEEGLGETRRRQQQAQRQQQGAQPQRQQQAQAQAGSGQMAGGAAVAGRYGSPPAEAAARPAADRLTR